MDVATIIVVLVVMVAIILGIRYLINSAVDKAGDAIEHAIARKKNADNPPQKEKLSDIYSNDRSNEMNSIVCSSCGKQLKEGGQFCGSCGMKT